MSVLQVFVRRGGVLHGPKLAEGGSSCAAVFLVSSIDFKVTALVWTAWYGDEAAFGGEWLMMAGSSRLRRCLAVQQFEL